MKYLFLISAVLFLSACANQYDAAMYKDYSAATVTKIDCTGNGGCPGLNLTLAGNPDRPKTFMEHFKEGMKDALKFGLAYIAIDGYQDTMDTALTMLGKVQPGPITNTDSHDQIMTDSNNGGNTATAIADSYNGGNTATMLQPLPAPQPLPSSPPLPAGPVTNITVDGGSNVALDGGTITVTPIDSGGGDVLQDGSTADRSVNESTPVVQPVVPIVPVVVFIGP